MGVAALASLAFGGGMPQGYAPGLNASTANAGQAARGEGGAQSGSALARFLGSSGSQRSAKAWLPGFNGRAHSGVAAQRRAARNRRQYLAQKRVGKNKSQRARA
jgi:hypothetical protein